MATRKLLRKSEGDRYLQSMRERAERTGEVCDVHERIKMLVSFDRNEGPRLLFKWFYANDLSTDDLRTLIPHVWTAAEFPTLQFGFDEWFELFWLAGFVTDKPGFEKPTEPLTIYRGAFDDSRHGPSWTTDLMVASWFWRRYKQGAPNRPAHVWTATAMPNEILGMFFGRSESEVIFDPTDTAAIKKYEGELPTDDEIDTWRKTGR